MIHGQSVRFRQASRFPQAIRLCIAVALCNSIVAVAAEDQSQHEAFFESKIRPTLVKHCYECHSLKHDAAEGGLTLDTPAGLLQGGDRGPAVVAGRPDASLIMTAITHADPDLTMPPDRDPLSRSIIGDFRQWIQQGAHDPRSNDVATDQIASVSGMQARRWKNDRDEFLHWAYRPIQATPPPSIAGQGWARSEIDEYILARLQSNALSPSPDASPSTLLRRVSLDLIGLPPNASQRHRFLRAVRNSDLDTAMRDEVDRLLALPQFGERWGRHWLDVARYAESSGKESNLTFPHAWRYRDYVIDSFNIDKPYDRFLVEQIAGDLLPASDEQQRAKHLIATGFLAIGPKSLNEMNPRQFKADLVDEQIDTVSRSILATSLACARCHDHKSDPFSMEDYYAVAGVFYSTDTRFGSSIGPESQIDSDFIRLPTLPQQSIPNHSFSEREFTKLISKVGELKWEKRLRMAQAFWARWTGKEPGMYYSLQDALRIRWSLGNLDAKLKTVDDDGQALPLAMGTVDGRAPRNVAVLRRGELSMPGDIVPRGFPAFYDSGHRYVVPENQSGRLELARWLTDPAHPLTARVIVNRIWQHLFGEGLVRTVDNFGSDGQTPSHPALLDHLATQFVAHDWSIKWLVREIALSRSYRQSSDYRDQAFQQDPENRLLWRANKRRLDAEVIRDGMLALAHRLDFCRPDASLVANIGNRPVSIIGFDKRVAADLDGSRYRSVYLPVIRDRLPDAMELFDGAEPSLVTGKRQTTNVPLQSLYLLNSEFLMQQSDALAARIQRYARSQTDRITLVIELCFCRAAEPDEIRIAKQFLGKQPDVRRWSEYCQALLCTAEFRNLD
tara:strand:- start:159131 stop:161659 length:2529 start_codon:yes stop_codon:yes gene_type:complete